MRRYHALDALRAAMMFLGIYLHAVAAYTPEAGWPWKQAEQTSTLLWSLSLIHVFRMPIFYAMAGFFTALLIARYGFRGAAWHLIEAVAKDVNDDRALLLICREGVQ